MKSNTVLAVTLAIAFLIQPLVVLADLTEPEPVTPTFENKQDLVLRISIDGTTLVNGEIAELPIAESIQVAYEIDLLPETYEEMPPGEAPLYLRELLADQWVHLELWQGTPFTPTAQMVETWRLDTSPTGEVSATIPVGGELFFIAYIGYEIRDKAAYCLKYGITEEECADPDRWSEQPPEALRPYFTIPLGTDESKDFAHKTTWAGVRFSIDAPQEIRASNILFLPGFLTSRLYTKEGGRERKLWEPNGSDDIRDLAMNADGTSKLPVYTRDIIGSVLELPFDATIYRNFMQYLDELENEGKINDWHGYAYDWRYDVFDIVDKGALKENGSREYVIAELERLVASSKSGKVTIIGHSNGGLLAKALMVRLREQGKEDLVDKVILIASPQQGTPKSAFALLHGREIALPFIIPAGIRRESASTMPGSYGLIPTPEYFNEGPVRIATFDPGAKTDAFRNAYGPSIESHAEMDSYLRNSPSTRGVPLRTDVGTPLPLSPTLLAKADSTHNAIDTWAPSAGTEVHEIAGWGQPTMYGASYVTKTVSCFAASCPTYVEYRPRFTNDGDDTVVSGSATAMDRQVYFDLYALDNLGSDRDEHRKHEDITESIFMHEYLESLLGLRLEYQSELFPKEKPVSINLNTVIGVHSPVTISIIDSSGRQTGIFSYADPKSDLLYVREEIPGSSVELGGESKFVILPKNENYKVQVSGTGSGTFALTFANADGTVFKEFVGVPVSSTTEATVLISGTTVGQFSLDTDGDGKAEAEFADKISRKDALALCKKEIGLIKTLAMKLYLGVVVASIELQGSDNVKLKNFVNQIRTYMEAQYRTIPAERQAGIAVCIAALENSKK